MKTVLRLIGILIAIGIGLWVLLMATLYLAAWWTSKSPAFFWP